MSGQARIARRIIPTLCISALLLSCAPATLSRIGPPRPQKPSGCPIDVLEPGATPERPIVDIGVVALKNCQEYTAGPCIKWLKKAACELGGEVAYLPDPAPPRDDFDATNFRVLVAVYTISTVDPPEGVCVEPTEASAEPADADCGE